MLKKYKSQLALLFVSFFVSLFLAEGFFTVYALMRHGKIDRQKLIRTRKELRDDVVGGIGNRFENRLILHPLFGYTYNPKDTGINNIGFPGKYSIDINKCGYSIKNSLGSELVVIGIFGGSFAEITGRSYRYLEEKLEPIFPNKKLIVMNFAVAGHALPQSAFVYMYFRELFDVVVFIDGLNELWNYVENNRAGFPPEYAKAVHYAYKVSRQELTPSQFDRTSRIISLKRKIHTITSISLFPIIRQSLFVHYAWLALEIRWSRSIGELSLEIEKAYKNGRKFFDVDDNFMLNYAAHQWSRYHNAIHSLASADGVLSIHLLQPNPFVPNSKIFTPEEQKLVTSSYPIKDYVENGYPKLKMEIRKLHVRGLIVEDLTEVFKNIDKSIWTDAAHVNETGAQVVMDKVAALVEANRNSIAHRHECPKANG